MVDLGPRVVGRVQRPVGQSSNGRVTHIRPSMTRQAITGSKRCRVKSGSQCLVLRLPVQPGHRTRSAAAGLASGAVEAGLSNVRP